MKKLALASLLIMAVTSPMAFSNDTAVKTVELPKAAVIDAKMDMEDTMKSMKKAFKKLARANSIEKMQEPAKTLATYASQSVVLAEKSESKKRDELVKGLNRLRVQIAQLQSFIDNNDLKGAKQKVKAINSQRKKAHKYFDV